ncbi:hypothetical protein TCAL_04270 [Tigriopus californicus]|uniref:long-chain-fatty-acid--CoA ligase n=1 Tax=Tigriopus californicus TaxID=6832 RepID=A0A553PMB2_TIGCA|nr:long-chain-fatty-acid--CoA ligase 4-like [Tigriopus californicus]TRY78823.1 hypothetical protein TCAL_04270 [Tigriopus californicus]
MAQSSLVVFLLKSWLFMWDVLTFPIYGLIYRKWNLHDRQKQDEEEPVNKNPQQIVRNGDSEVEIRPFDLHFSLMDQIASLEQPLDTVVKLFDYSVKLHAGQDCLGTREAFAMESEVQPDGKVFQKIIQGDYYTWLKYEQVQEKATNIAKGLIKIGMNPKEEDKALIYADTSANWLMTALGCFKTGIPLATLYTTLGEESVKYGLNQTKAKTLILAQELMPKLERMIGDLPHVENIVYIPSRVRQPLGVQFKNRAIYSLEQIQDLGREAGNVHLSAPKSDDIAVIMYTSGSTGTPKGALLTHRNLSSAIFASLSRGLDMAGEQRTPDETYMGFLPIAHIFELSHEFVVLLMGIKIGYSGPNTLTDKSTMIKSGQKGDASILKPTVMLAVPTILDRVYKAIQGNVQSKGKVFEAVFMQLYRYRCSWLKRGFGTPILNRLVFSKLKQSLGGKIRLIIGGGAPLSPDVHEFIRTCLDVHVAQGYGLTETVGGVMLTQRKDLTMGSVGFPLPSVKVKLVDWSEGEYTIRDPQGPKGEIVIGGPVVSVGYFDLPDKTAESFYRDAEGTQWFYTGDIGHLLPNGNLKIIDRKKDLVKLAMGEYVSLGKVEAAMKVHPLVENICIYADSSQSATIAIIVPDAVHLSKIQTEVELTHEEACQNPQVKSQVLSSLRKHASTSLQKFEMPRGLLLVSEPWSPESGLVTASLKIRRKQIEKAYQDQIDRIYAQLN